MFGLQESTCAIARVYFLEFKMFDINSLLLGIILGLVVAILILLIFQQKKTEQAKFSDQMRKFEFASYLNILHGVTEDKISVAAEVEELKGQLNEAIKVFSGGSSKSEINDSVNRSGDNEVPIGTSQK